MQTETYKGIEIEISQDIDASNPFTDWDCEPSLMYEGDRNSRQDYSDGGIHTYLTHYLTDNQLIRHQRKLLEVIEYGSKEAFDEEYPKNEFNRQDRVGVIRDLLHEYLDEGIEEMTNFCEEFNIPHYSSTSRGYSQGDWANVLVVPTDEDIKRVGFDKTKLWDITESAFKLFGYWAWGDVYSFYIEEIGDSCGGYYGDNHEESGLMEHAKDSIDSYLERKRRDKQKKTKTLITNRVPLEVRAQQLLS